MVIPVHNEEAVLDSCLFALFSQVAAPEFEVIVVNNNSTDSSVEIAGKYPVRILSEENIGQASARNTGFRHASADVIASTDADVIVPSTWLCDVYKNFSDSNCQALTGPCTYTDGHFIARYGSRFLQVPYFKFIRFLTGIQILISGNFAIRKGLFFKSGGFKNGKGPIDVELGTRIGRIAPIRFDPRLIVKTSGRLFKRLTFRNTFLRQLETWEVILSKADDISNI